MTEVKEQKAHDRNKNKLLYKGLMVVDPIIYIRPIREMLYVWNNKYLYLGIILNHWFTTMHFKSWFDNKYYGYINISVHHLLWIE